MVSPASTPTTSCSLSFSDQNLNTFTTFLELMTRHDKMHGSDAVVLFQPIAETDKSLPKLRYLASPVSQLNTIYPQLVELNQQGYSLHWAINEYGYMGELPEHRYKQNVSRARTYAVDIDRYISLPLLDKLIEIFKPTAVVLSSRLVTAPELFEEDGVDQLMVRQFHPEVLRGTDEQGEYTYCDLYKVHFYWQLGHRFNTETKIDPVTHLTSDEQIILEQWDKVQNSLAWRVDDEINWLIGTPETEDKHWTDKGLLPLSQTLRLPGFYHLKKYPEVFITALHKADGAASYDYQALYALFSSLFLTPQEIQNDWERLNIWKNSKPKRKFNLSPDILLKPGFNAIEGYPGAGAGGRNETLHRYACYLLFQKKLTPEETLAICFEENNNKNIPPLDDLEVESIVTSAANYKEQKDPSPKKTFSSSTDSNKAILKAKLAPLLTNSTDTGGMFGLIPAQLIEATKALKADSKPVDEASWDERCDKHQRLVYNYNDGVFDELVTDQSLVERLKQRYARGFKLHPTGDIRFWDGVNQSWEAGDRYAHACVLNVSLDALQEPAVLRTFLTVDGSLNKKALNALKIGLLSDKRTTAVIKMAKRSQDLLVDADKWDSHQTLLNCKNGVLDIATGEVLEPSPEYYLTRKANVSLKENIKSDIDSYRGMNKKAILSTNRWTKFVYEIMLEDIEMYYYLQKIAGYCLAGGNPHELLFFFYGHGANGKSMFSETFSRLMGTYSFPVPADALLTDGKDRSKILAQLPGLRLALSSELSGGKAWNEETLKDITGQDAINVRPIYQQSFYYTPQFKVIVRGNAKPKIRGQNYGIWRRLRMVPFDRIFYPHERDLTLKDQLGKLDHEILCWALAGYQMVQETGLTPPMRAAEAYVEYRNETMPVLGFIFDVFDLPASKIEAGSLEQGIMPHKVIVNGSGNSGREQDPPPGDANNTPTEFTDLVDAAKLYRLYIAWYGRKTHDKMSERELWDACEALGIKKRKFKLVSETAQDKEPRPTWCLGLRVKPDWDIKSKSGKAIFGNFKDERGLPPKVFQ